MKGRMRHSRVRLQSAVELMDVMADETRSGVESIPDTV